MNAINLITIPIIGLVTMIGTAEGLFTSTISTILFALAFATFAQCSIYIGKNKKWLIKEESEQLP